MMNQIFFCPRGAMPTAARCVLQMQQQAHSETLKNEKNSTPSKQSKLKKINKEIESISPIKKQKLNKSKSNFMLYN